MMHRFTDAVLPRLWPFALFCLLAVLICPFLGAVPIDIGQALSHAGAANESLDASILFVTRLPRVVLAALTGSALAVGGVVFQALLRNPLATPYTLGVSSGGALGAVLAIKFGLVFAFLGLSSVAVFAFLFALATVGMVYLLAHSRGRLPTSILLLAGVSVSFFISALILFAHYVADYTESHKMIRWLMGGLDVVGFEGVWSILPMYVLGMLMIFPRMRDLDQLSFGEILAHSRGVDVNRSQKICYLASSLLVSSVVCLGGPIGFVGLIVPHSVRFLVGPSHRILLPASAFAGAGFLILCDTVGRTMFAPTELPVGILTALIGGPFFIGLLFREKKKFQIGS